MMELGSAFLISANGLLAGVCLRSRGGAACGSFSRGSSSFLPRPPPLTRKSDMQTVCYLSINQIIRSALGMML